MSTSTNLTRTQKRERAQRAARRYHPTFTPATARPGSMIARVITTRAERHTQNVTAIARIHAATQRVDVDWIDSPDVCMDCQLANMDTHACPNNHGFCVDCCHCPEHKEG